MVGRLHLCPVFGVLTGRFRLIAKSAGRALRQTAYFVLKRWEPALIVAIVLDFVAAKTAGWYPRGIILDPEVKAPSELRRLDFKGILLPTKEKAEALALLLCKTWIDERG
jgi:hypothetical protein